MYTRILVPLDGSATAEAVLPYAEAFAAGFKTSVELMSVIDIGAMTTHLAADKVRHLDTIIATEEKNAQAIWRMSPKSFLISRPSAGLFAAHRRRPFLKQPARTAIR